MPQLTIPFDANTPRLSGQRLKILERLQQGPATNMELTGITHRFSARIHELRGMGYRIKTVAEQGGVFRFELEE